MPALPPRHHSYSDEAALDRADTLIAEAVGEFREVFEFLAESEQAADAESDERADAFRAVAAEWQPVARRVDRPAVAVNPRWTTDIVDDGKVVGT